MAEEQPAFAPNQEWAYRSRPQDAGPTLVIGLIEDHPKMGRVIHITVRNVNIKSSRAPEFVTHGIGHFPMSEAALTASVTRLIGVVDPPPSVLVGVKSWQAAQGGVFTITVAEA